MHSSTFETFRHRFVTSLCALALAGTGALAATGAMAQQNYDLLKNDSYRLKFNENTANTNNEPMDEIQVNWTMGTYPGFAAEVKYSSSVNIRDIAKIRGRVFIHQEATQTGAHRAWFEFQAEANEVKSVRTLNNELTNCSNSVGTVSQGYCKAPKSGSDLLLAIPNGEKFRHYVKTIAPKTIELGIINLSKNKTYVLGSITTTNSTGPGSDSMRTHITFNGNRTCANLPVVTYSVQKAYAKKGGKTFDYIGTPEGLNPNTTCSPKVGGANTGNITVQIPG